MTENERKDQLRQLEDKRLAFAERERGFAPDSALYVQRDGGFWGLARENGGIFLIYGPGPGENRDFSIEKLEPGAFSAELREAFLPSKGMGGVLGFGTRGGRGFTLAISREGREPVEMTLLGGIGAYMERKKDGGALFTRKRRRKDANFVWDFKSGTYFDVKKIGEKWEKLVLGGAAD